jgi:general secretion pathway protein G
MLVGAHPPAAAVAVRLEAGFSLLQLVAAIAILGVLSMIAIPGFQGYLERARQTQALADLGEMEIAIGEFSTNQAGQLPASLAAAGFPGAVDPWGNAWVYVNLTLGGSPRTDQSGVAVNTTYDLYSAGPDGLTALSLTAGESEDDIVRANDGGYIGVVEDYTRLD